MDRTGAAEDRQRYSLFHGGDAREPGLKAWHAPYADRFRGATEVLDLGCGPGYFLDLLRDRGIRGIGVDIDAAMVNAARSRGHDARLGDHTLVATFDEALDGVHLSHVIEHLWGDDAVALLEASSKALRPGGTLVVRTPNWGNETVRNGGFWLDHTHKRPYPLELLTQIIGDLGLEVIVGSFEPGGWEDTVLVARKPARVPLVARIIWHGDFFGEGSLSRVNRSMVRALLAHGGYDVIPCGEPTPQVEASLNVPVRRREAFPDDDVPTIVLRHKWPVQVPAPRERFVFMQPFEFGALPRDWTHRLITRADACWGPSRYVCDLYRAAGIPDERLHVVPNGIDPAVYHPEVEPLPVDDPRVCVFLFVGGMVDRKNLSGLVEAYTRTFDAREPVALLIKDNPGIYPEDGVAAKLKALQDRSDIPSVRYLSQKLDDATMARLFRIAAALVMPSKGEGFGMPALEAMACGVPVIATAGTAMDDFIDESVGYPVRARRISLGDTVAGFALANEGWILEPEIDELCAAMRRVYERRDEAASRGRAAARRVHERFTWAHSAQAIVGGIDALLASPPMPSSAPYEDRLSSYHNHAMARGGVDGMLYELFSRLRVDAPYFVEIDPGDGSEANAAYFIRSFGWAGLFVESERSSYECLAQRFQGIARVRTVHERLEPNAFAALLQRHGVPHEFDLLALGRGDGARVLDGTLAVFRPRAIVTASDDEAAITAVRSRGYTVLGGDPEGGGTVLARADLAERLGFAPC